MKKQLKLPASIKNAFLYQAQKRKQSYKTMLEQGIQQNLQLLRKISRNVGNRKTREKWRPIVEVDEAMLRECAENLNLSENTVLTIAAIMSLVPTMLERDILDFGAILQEVTDYVDSHEEFLSDDFGRDGNITLFFIKRCAQELIQKYPDADEDTFLAIYNSIVPPPYDYIKHWDIALAYYRKLKQN